MDASTIVECEHNTEPGAVATGSHIHLPHFSVSQGFKFSINLNVGSGRYRSRFCNTRWATCVALPSWIRRIRL